MVKKISAIILSAIMTGISIFTCIIAPNSIDLTAITREKEKNSVYIFIDDDVIALSGNPSLISAECVLILDNVNVQRAAAGLGSLIQTNELAAAATIRAKEQEQLFSHTRPNGTEWYTVDSSCCYGECLSKGYNEHEVTTAWMNSPTHKAVIMDGSYKTAGIGYYINNGICYIALETGY